MASRYHHLTDGEWCRPIRKGFREQCCDCGLIHDVQYRIVDGHIEFKTTRNAKATAAARKHFKFSKDE